ncbi:flagellar export chaperone FliS [Desulfurella sp.]|uniref:flagellar export chaperone FliS n=1 Tax=Desulfurella sp. TaxID=1962857 RepID=UPI0025C0ADCD|nr:flagellar export chaperone FliS [Desulfurella sp.]
MIASSAYKAYKNTLANTTDDRLNIIGIMYDGALSFAVKAKESIENKNILEKVYAIERLNSILLALRNVLDVKNYPEAGKFLESIYDFLLLQTLKANLNNNIEEMEVVIRYLQKMSEIWNNDVLKK